MTQGRGRSMRELIESGEKAFSFEFFPPRDEAGERQLWQAITELEPYRPTFVSVTYGAGGGTRDRTIAVTEKIARETSLLPVAHLTCVGHTRAELQETLRALEGAGVQHVMALRGDPPGGPGADWEPVEGGLSYASELVELIGQTVAARVGVAAFPEGHVDAASLEADAWVLKAKQDAGAEFAVTEMVLRAADYFGLVERARAIGVDLPIIPGVMPVLSLKSMRRMAELSRRDLPLAVTERLMPFEHDPEGLRAEGIRLSTQVCEELLTGGAPGLHFYTLNRSRATREIFQGLQITV